MILYITAFLFPKVYLSYNPKWSHEQSLGHLWIIWSYKKVLHLLLSFFFWRIPKFHQFLKGVWNPSTTTTPDSLTCVSGKYEPSSSSWRDHCATKKGATGLSILEKIILVVSCEPMLFTRKLNQLLWKTIFSNRVIFVWVIFYMSINNKTDNISDYKKNSEFSFRPTYFNFFFNLVCSLMYFQ